MIYLCVRRVDPVNFLSNVTVAVGYARENFNKSRTAARCARIKNYNNENKYERAHMCRNIICESRGCFVCESVEIQLSRLFFWDAIRRVLLLWRLCRLFSRANIIRFVIGMIEKSEVFLISYYTFLVKGFDFDFNPSRIDNGQSFVCDSISKLPQMIRQLTKINYDLIDHFLEPIGNSYQF